MSTTPQARSTGTLTVVVQTAGGALPVAGAQVTVFAADGTRSIVVTDESGRSPTLILAAPPVADSLAPGGRQPYAVYTVTVSRDGFYSTENRQVPLFAGVNSVQPVELLPIPPYESEEIKPTQNTDFIAGQKLN